LIQPSPRRRRRGDNLLNFAPRRDRSAFKATTRGAPPTAERRAQVQILRTLGIVELDQKITAAEMKAYDCLFTMPIPRSVLAAIAALVDRDLATASSPAAVDIAREA